MAPTLKECSNLDQVRMLVPHMYQSGDTDLLRRVDAIALPPFVDCSIRTDILADGDSVGNGGAVTRRNGFAICSLYHSGQFVAMNGLV